MLLLSNNLLNFFVTEPAMVYGKVSQSSNNRQYCIGDGIDHQSTGVPSKVNDVNYLQVYILYRCHRFLYRWHNSTKMITKLFNDLDRKLSGCPVFFNHEQAESYSRCLGGHYMILKAYVTPAAIEGNMNELLLKPGFIAPEQVESCLLTWQNPDKYLSNPTFDHDFLTY